MMKKNLLRCSLCASFFGREEGGGGNIPCNSLADVVN